MDDRKLKIILNLDRENATLGNLKLLRVDINPLAEGVLPKKSVSYQETEAAHGTDHWD